jgi:MFS family permease
VITETQANLPSVETSIEALPPEIEYNSRRNFLAFATDILSFMTGLSFIPATIVLVGMAQRLTSDKALLGVIAMTGSVMWFLPQIVAARLVHGKRRQKPYLIISSLIGRQTYLLMALWLLFTRAEQPLLTVLLLIVCIGIFHACDSLAGVAWFDMMSRALSPRMRGRSIAIGSFVGLAAGLGSAFIVERILSPGGLSFPTSYAVIFICAWVCFMVSWVAVVCIKETPMSEDARSQLAESHFVADLLGVLRHDGTIRLLMLARVLTGMETMAAAFYVVFIRERLGLPDASLGVFAFASVAGGLIGLAVFGLMGDRFGSLRVIRVSVAVQVLGPLLALAVAAVPAIPAGSPDVALALLVVVIAINGAIGQAGMLGFQVYPLDAAPERHRAMYIGVLNSVGGVVSLTPALGGLLIDWLSASSSSVTAYVLLFAIATACVAAGLLVSFKLPKPVQPA